jgi:hypothetical protein
MRTERRAKFRAAVCHKMRAARTYFRFRYVDLPTDGLIDPTKYVQIECELTKVNLPGHSGRAVVTWPISSSTAQP